MFKKLLSITFIALFFTSNIFAADRVNMSMQLYGTASGYESFVPDIDGDGNDDPAVCFDLEVRDINTGLRIGDGTDCLSNITPVGDGLQVIATTYFKLPSGTLVSRGTTTVQPTTGGSPSFTHITGAVPDSGVNNVLSGTGAFKRAKGRVRLSGAVNLSQEGIISFDCLFIADISKSKNSKRGHKD